MVELRRQGLAQMNEVYAWEMSDMPGDFFALTVDHLFGDIWSRPGLSMRDKRLITLSVVTALGLPDLAEIQVNAALENEEMTSDELREMAIFITHYVGFPLGSGFNGVVERVAAKRQKAADAGKSDDRKASAGEALKMHSAKKSAD